MDLKIPPKRTRPRKVKEEESRDQRGESKIEDEATRPRREERKGEGSPLAIDLGVHHFTLDVGDTKVLSNLSGQGLELSCACNNQRGEPNDIEE